MGKDRALLLSKRDDGEVLALRSRDEQVELARMRPIVEGQAVLGELVQLTPNEATPLLYDVETLHTPKELDRSGPARVSSPAYRAGWDRLFGRCAKDELN